MADRYLEDYKDISTGLPPSLSLVGKTAIVTGSARGIGSAIALSLASRGANIAITYTSDSSTVKAQEIADKAVALGRKATLIKCDLAREDCGTVVVNEALKGLGVQKIDILINNAALPNPGGPHSVEDGFSPADFDTLFHVNVRAPALLLQALLPHLVEKGGRIINITSLAARANYPNYQLYAASKGALDSLTRSWAKEIPLKYGGCTVNSVIVGPTATADAPDSPARQGAKALMTVEKRLGRMDDVAEVVGFLASEGSRWVNGDHIGANGGIYVQS